MSKPSTREVIEAARAKFDYILTVPYILSASRDEIIANRDALQALLDSGDSFGVDKGWNGYVYDKAAEQMRERCAKECKPTLHSSRIRDNIRNLPLRGKDE